jgi:putative lysine transport system substrate-binding protein
MSNLLGIRHSCGHTIFDPVLSKELDGLTSQMELSGRDVKFTYCVSGNGRGVRRIEINGADIEFGREPNPYRLGGAVIEDTKLKTALNKNNNTIKISL